MAAQLTRLANGLTVAIDPMPGARSSAIGLYAGVGSRSEAEGKGGLAHLLEHMVFKGARGRDAGATSEQILRGARSAAPGKPLHGERQIRQALWRGLSAASPGDVLVFTCAGSFNDLVEGVRLKSPAAADRIALEVAR